MRRLFIAVDLPERVRDEISDLYCAIPGARWTEDAKLHITLRFIGEVDSVMAGRIDALLRTVDFTPFTLTLKSTGFFPPRGRPKVLWCGISGGDDLARLQKQIERGLTSKLGLPPEDKKFHPHITIARLSDAPDGKLADFLTSNALFETGEFMVSEFVLYSSVLNRDGAIYTKEVEYSMGNG
ncbi:MAG: RNA 2',3'-cyclic phosphodiesterase [Chitinispirillia bacterium]|nr:RNA 2',3'-cyclic phosphodiesterase [Chitinispirillia bacterium]MCL2269301.1 RNA 2',3'-cyclic phosphodiesterase [Chitinispirillia bacterium]